MQLHNKRPRRQSGSAISEMGPALFLLLVMLFFPMLDLLGIAAAYSSCLYLNLQQVKEASIVPSSDATSSSGQVQKGVVDSWLSAGLGKFVKTTQYPKSVVSYRSGLPDPTTKIVDKFVSVSTTVSCQPFLTIPFFFPVPGLSAPMSFTFASEAEVENPDNAS